ncbi:MAG: RcpC/CpaB family pilus assembly protein [Chloroflexota bacterium]|nr:RcpC/CpaB family pilus assembly protein [Chloroflexota bacterium]
MPAVEYEYTDTNRRRSKLYIGVGLVIALVAAGSVYLVTQQASLGNRAQAAMRDVVVAVRDIPSRKPIEEGDVTVRSVVADSTNQTAFTRIDEVLNRVSGVSIAAGQLITRNVLASAAEGQAFSILDPGTSFDPLGPDWRAVSVSVPDDRAVAGLLQAGQRVDLLVTMAINPELGPKPDPSATPTEAVIPGPSTKETLQALTILARNGAMYILRTDLATAEQIAELQAAGGQFALVLRPEEDGRTATTLGSTIDMLLEQFDFPIPRVPDFGEVSPTPTPAP